MRTTTKEHGKYPRLTALITGYFAIGLDSYLVIMALPSITKGMRISFDDAGWILLMLLIGRQFSVLVSGRAGDKYGRKPMFIAGAALFGLGAILSTSAPAYWMLLAFRVFQGFAAGMMEANFPALITVSFPTKQRGKALGIASAAIALSALVGVVLSGVICDAFGWRYIFLAVVPFCVAAVPLCYYLVPDSRGLRAGPRDSWGSVLLLSTATTLALFLTYGATETWHSPVTITFFTISVLGAILLYLQEKTARSPLLSTKLFKIPTFTVSILAYLAVVTCQMMVYLTAPFLLDYYMGLTARGAGLIIVIALGTAFLFLVPSGIAADFFGDTRPLENAGLLMIAAALAVLAFVGSRMTMTTVVISMVMLGIGGGLFASPNYSSVMGSVPRPSLGVAGGIYGTVTTMATFFAFALSDAVLGRWGDIKESAAGSRLALFNPEVHAAIRHVYVAAFIVAVVGLAVCLLKYWSQREVEPARAIVAPAGGALPARGEAD
ncbi:MAG: MFS transporter [Candidatus Geothermincolia bacterium]